MRGAIRNGYVGTKGLPANWIRDKNRNLSAEDGDGREAVGKTARDQWWAKLLRLLTVNSLSYFVKIKY